jgi:hypothetical protein
LRNWNEGITSRTSASLALALKDNERRLQRRIDRLLDPSVLRLVRCLPGPLTAIRETFAENLLDAITLAKNGFL